MTLNGWVLLIILALVVSIIGFIAVTGSIPFVKKPKKDKPKNNSKSSD